MCNFLCGFSFVVALIFTSSPKKKIRCYFCLHFVLFACLFIHVVRSPFMRPSFLFNGLDSVGIIRPFFSSSSSSDKITEEWLKPEEKILWSEKQSGESAHAFALNMYMCVCVCCARIDIIEAFSDCVYQKLFYLMIQKDERTNEKEKKQSNRVHRSECACVHQF